MATTLQEAFEENVRPYIDLIDELRLLGLDKDVPLPAVVVVGDQSAGKSSVLEAISGVQLPRGTDIVTRCPLELRLKKLNAPLAGKLLCEDEQKNIPLTWKGTIKYPSNDTTERPDDFINEEIEDPSSVGPKVEEATNRITGSGSKGISDKLIHLEVQSTSVPDLTLIDLPGIARISVEGQSKDVPQQTKQLIKKYINKPETIILAVVPCNIDIATTEALQLAREVDPDGKRTLGVLTKPDLVDEGTENGIVQIVNGEKVKLRLGYTVVRCRGQKDIENSLSLENALEKEENFFKNHEVFNFLYKEGKTGIRNLSHQLSKQLVEQIKRYMPDLKAKIKEQLEIVNKELEKYGDVLPDSDYDRQNYLMDMTLKLGDVLKRMSNAENVDDKIVNDLKMYKRIKEEFKKLAGILDKKIPKRTDKKMIRELEKNIVDNKGKELPSFLPYSIFENIVREKLIAIRKPSEDCLRKVNDIIDNTLSQVIQHKFSRYQPLMMEVTQLMNKERTKSETIAKDALKNIFAMEHMVFTQDVNFTHRMKEYEKEEKEQEEQEIQRRAQKQVALPAYQMSSARNSNWFRDNGNEMDAKHMAKCLEAYFQVVVTRLIDIIPMAISYHLKQQLIKRLSLEIVKLSASPEKCKQLLKEDPEIVYTRNKLLEKQERLQKARLKLMNFNTCENETEDNNHQDNNHDEDDDDDL